MELFWPSLKIQFVALNVTKVLDAVANCAAKSSKINLYIHIGNI